MRNLDVRVHSGVSIGIPDGETTSWHHCTDSDTTFVFNGCRVYKLLEGADVELLADLGAEGLMAPDAICVGLVSLPDLQAVLVGLSSGQLLQVGTDNMGMVEEVGCVECGLACLVMSPDLEIITLVTNEMVVITMTRDYMPIKETRLLQDQFGEGEFVNVGWGKKETQFHGKAGKDSRVVKVEPGKVVTGDDGFVKISWRGDGQMFCVSYITPGGEGGQERRRFRVLERSGNLYSTSEECVGLQWSLAWRPSGSLIAAAVSKPNKQVVAFFEKNGLQHGEFSVSSEMGVAGLAWSCDSEVLAVWGDKVIQLWVRGNYHWYRKQEIVVEGSLVQPAWSGEDPSVIRFVVRGEKGEEMRTVRLGWVTAVSQGVEGTDLAMCAVVDGDRVKVTPFRELIVPPPSSAFEVHVGSQVQQVVFPFSGEGESLLAEVGRDSNSMLAVTKDKIFIFNIQKSLSTELNNDIVKITGAGGNGFTVRSSRYICAGQLEADSGLGFVTNMVWIGGYLVGSVASPSPALVVYQSKGGKLELIDTLPCEEPVYLMAPCPSGAVVQLLDGTILTLVLEDGQTCLVPADLKFPSLCSPLIWTTGGVLGLTSRYRLYLGSRELACNITSLAMHSHFLLATTLDHRLVSLPLAQLCGDTVEWESAGTRRVERGSRLVCAVARHSKTILQMPRGNLEIIQPRSLAIIMVADLMEGRKYHDAFLLARRQRMNLNLLVDHNMDDFMANCEKFVAQISPSSDHLNIFLADLVEEDVCSTMYSSQYPGRKVKQGMDKVAKVCARVREELIKQDTTEHNVKNMLSILGTLVRDGGKLEEALMKIKLIQEAGLNSHVDDALRFLTYMVDVNALFDVALGTYNFELVIMVAEKSQKDPKEYLPFLNNFKQMEDNFRKYSIDKHLKRYESALTHIAKCHEQFDICIELVKEQRLFKQALELFPVASDNYKQVCQCYAAYLESKRYHEEASLLYERAGSLDLAVGQAELGLRWQRAGYLARRSKWSADKLVELYRNLASKLESSGRGTEAALLWREWLQDPEEAVAVLARCHQWQEVLRQARDGNREDLVETHIRPAMVERRETLAVTVKSLGNQLKDLVDRLVLVRKTRNSIMQGGHDMVEDDDRNVEDADMFSDTTSVGGASTIKSRSTLQTRNTSRSKSSKNRRKADRKLYSIKEGSMYEDIGIMSAVHELLSGLPPVRDEIGQLLRGLVEIGVEHELSDLQSGMQNLLEQAEAALPVVWIPDMADKSEGQDKFGPEATVEDIVRGGMAKTEYSSPIQLLPSNLRYPPQLKKDLYWKLQFL